MGWFPLQHIELVHDTAVAEIGTQTGANALDAFIREAKEKGPLSLPVKKQEMKREETLDQFLANRPMVDQLVMKNILPSAETEEQVAAAQKRLLKNQKKPKKDSISIIESNLNKGWSASNPLELTEDQVDRIAVEIVYKIPLTKQKKTFSSYESVFSGATLLQELQAGVPSIVPKFQNGISADQATTLATNLTERHIIYNVQEPEKPAFKPKNLYQPSCVMTEYSILNFNKICHKPEKSLNAYKESIAYVGEIVEAMKKYLPDFETLRASPEFRGFSLRLSTLQIADLKGSSQAEQTVFWVNLFNALILYAHVKFKPPTTATERRFLFEYCYVYFNGKRWSLQDIETEALKFATKEDPLVYLCLSDATASTPATFIFSADNLEDTKIFATRHFFRRCVKFNPNDYEIQFPRLFQRVWKDLKIEKEDLVQLFKPYMMGMERDEVTKMTELGQKIDVKFLPYSYQPSYLFEETSPLSPR